MTEADWLACDDPIPMLEWLRSGGYAGDSTLWRFVLACYRDVWAELKDEKIRGVVEVMERYLDDPADEGVLEAVRGAFAALADKVGFPCSVAMPTAGEAAPVAVRKCVSAARIAAWSPLVEAAGLDKQPDWETIATIARDADRVKRKAQAALLRDVVGNPFRPSPAIEPFWLTWNDGAVSRLARAVAERHDSAGAAAVADALEAAGCTEASLLGHLRGPGPHVRGCWAVDRLLGRR